MYGKTMYKKLAGLPEINDIMMLFNRSLICTYFIALLKGTKMTAMNQQMKLRIIFLFDLRLYEDGSYAF